MATVEFLDVDKTYPDGTEVLTRFNLNVEDGELMVIVGPSGCGKSTALRLLAGLDPVSSGEIRIAGQRVNDYPPSRRDVSMVFQNYALYPHMTVRRNLEFPLRMAKVPKSQVAQRVRQTADLLNLGALLEKRPNQLSGGQRQRVAMGRAIIRRPQVFLMDEPLSNLDAQLRIKIRAEITRLQKRLGTTALYVTHDQVEAMTLGSRIAVIDQGRLQQVGSPRELHNRPANTFVASFLGNPGMNIFPVCPSSGNLAPGPDSNRIRLSPGGEVVLNHMEALPRQPAFIGLRPEALSLQPSPATLEVRVESAETLGHETLLYFSFGGHPEGDTGGRWVARLPSQWQAPDGKVKLGFAPEQLHFFDAKGNAL